VQLYFLALIALSLAGVIEERSSTPGLRPEAPAADRAFRILGRAAFAFWLVLLGWGFWTLHWSQPVAGLLGSLLAAAFSSLVLKRLLDSKFQFDPWATAAAVVLTALLANASGWLASLRILRQKPLEVLRES